MASLVECAVRPVKAGAWRSEDSGRTRTIYHYSTPMLSFELAADGWWDGDIHSVFTSIGRGSVSDQGGMNKLFRKLGMPFYFSRKGGAEIRDTKLI